MRLPHPNPGRVGYVTCPKCGSIEWKILDRERGIVQCDDCGKQVLQYGRLDRIRLPKTNNHWRSMVD